MGFSTSTVYLLLSFIVLSKSQGVFRDVNTDQGTVRGYNVDDGQVFSFYGIPYATTPRGVDRFKAPLPGPTWTNIFNAVDRNISCPQGVTTVNVVNRQTTTLDCLIANLWVPNNASMTSNLPVYVYLHGGFFQSGNANEMIPVELVKRGIIVVSVNYRLGVHGFLCLGTEYAPGNAGLKDQLAALRWIRRNIANFGGNPENVTLGGSNAGSVATELHMLSSASDGLFNKIITESGSALSWTWFESNYLEKAENYARQNVDQTNFNLQQLENFFRNLTDNELNHPYSRNHRSFGFLPCVETHNVTGVERFLTEHPENITRSGRFVNRPNLSGFTSMEGLYFSQRFEIDIPSMQENFNDFMPLNLGSNAVNASITQRAYNFYFPQTPNINSSDTFVNYTNFYTDTIFSYYQYYSARLLSPTAPVYFYIFSYNGSLINSAEGSYSLNRGPGHSAQSLYVYESRNPNVNYSALTSADILTQERLRDMWSNFIRLGQPIPSATSNLNITWARLNNNQGNYLDIGSQLTVGQGFPLANRLSFWDDIYMPVYPPSSAGYLRLSVSILALSFMLAVLI